MLTELHAVIVYQLKRKLSIRQFLIQNIPDIQILMKDALVVYA